MSKIKKKLKQMDARKKKLKQIDVKKKKLKQIDGADSELAAETQSILPDRTLKR